MVVPLQCQYKHMAFFKPCLTSTLTDHMLYFTGAAHLHLFALSLSL